MKYDDKNTPAPHDTAAFGALCETLENTLLSSENQNMMLRRQAAMLDEMMTALMSDHLAERLKQGQHIERWLDMVLRLQKQCTDTVKSVEAIDYMRSISRPRPKLSNELSKTEKYE